MRLLRFLSVALLGLLSGCAGWRLADLGYFQHWEKLSVSPQDTPAYFATGDPLDRVKLCDFQDTEFSWMVSPPKNVTNCVQRFEPYPEGYRRTTYVLDNQDVMWKWEFFSYGYDALVGMICIPGLGLFVGLSIATVLEIVSTRRRNRPAAFTHAGKQTQRSAR